MDCDELFAFSTPRYVVIRDRWLGFLQLLGIVGMIVYFFLVKVYMGRSYLELAPIKGTFEYVIQLPPRGEIKEPAEFPYCKEYLGVAPATWQHKCITMDMWTAQMGSTQETIFVATRVRNQVGINVTCLQEDIYSEDTTYCMIPQGKSADFFLTNIEEGLVYIQHVASAGCDRHGKCHEFVRSADTTGEFRCASRYAKAVNVKTYQGREYDVFTIHDLLDCVGMGGLDAPISEDSSPIPHREYGLSLALNVHYEHNYFGNIKGYYYSVNILPIRAKRIISDPERAKAAQPGQLPVNMAYHQVRNGVAILLQQSGMQGGISFSHLVLSVVETTALLTLVSIAMRACMKYVLPLREIYTAMMYHPIPELSDFRRGDLKAVMAVDALLDENARLGATSHVSVARSESEDMLHATVLKLTKRLEELEAWKEGLVRKDEILHGAPPVGLSGI